MTETGWRKYLPLVLVAVVSSLVTAAVFQTMERIGRSTLPSPPAPVQTTGPAAESNAFIAARKRVEPAVVYLDVQTVREGPQLPEEGLFPFLNPFREFFGPEIRKGTGSGFIFRQDGYILTNAHVVDGAQSLQVTLADKRKFTGHVTGLDREIDLAVIKIDATGLPAVTQGDSDQLQAGQWVLAIGNPLGYHYTVTAGIVSALNRSLENPDQNGYLIQTDAAINPGNSGGPLIDLNGNVVGINEAIRADAQGMGFAIPINLAKQRLKDLSAGLPARQPANGRPWLGIAMGDLGQVPADVRGEYGLRLEEGVYIAQVVTGSPADKAGLRQLDVITAIDGHPIKTMAEVRGLVQKAKAGQTVSLLIDRRGQLKLVRAKLELKPLGYAN